MLAADFFNFQILYFASKCFSMKTFYKSMESLLKAKWNFHMHVLIVLQIFFLLATEIY